jgi:hypothetical protein
MISSSMLKKATHVSSDCVSSSLFLPPVVDSIKGFVGQASIRGLRRTMASSSICQGPAPIPMSHSLRAGGKPGSNP